MEPKQKTNYTTVDEYIAAQPPGVRAGLKLLRETIKKAAPQAEELISYRIPAFKFHGMLVYYAVFKNHYGLYALANTIKVFGDKLKAYELSKGTIRFPLDEPIPVKLVTEIVKFRVKENLEKAALKAEKSGKTKHRHAKG